ncbi:hypothetical protein KBA39_03835 [Myxococcota bacterium]|nr:hypothetical protein [Myxococcota bacterium]
MDSDMVEVPGQNSGEGPVLQYQAFLKGVIEGLGDPRVSSVLLDGLFDEVSRFITDGFFEAFNEAALKLETPFAGFPDEVTGAPDPVDAAITFVRASLGEHQQTLALAVLIGVTDFVVANRDRVIDLMRSAGDGPCEDRAGRLARAASAITAARESGARIASAESMSDAETIVEEVRASLEEVRDELGAQILDDAIVWGARIRSAASDGSDQARDTPPEPDDRPALTPGGRRSDVEQMLVDSWLLEMDLLLDQAALVDKPVSGLEVVSEEQREYILDALVAVQEAFTIRQDPAILLKFGQLRLAKGDVGEARAAAEKVIEMVGDEESELHAAAVELHGAVAEASPLTRRDRRCFIATAAMADPDAPEVDALRDFRDDVLAKSAAGRLAIRFYYLASPPFAAFIERHPHVARAVREWFIIPVAAFVGSRDA